MHAIARSCEIKAQVVAADERESDRRRILNYGHTIGHALESLAGYRGLIHGEAVGIGLVQEADLACHMGLCGRDVVERIRSLVQRAGLSEQVPRASFTSLWGAMQHDKKVVGGRVIGVWPVRIGEVVIRPMEQQVCAAWFQSEHGRGSDCRVADSRASILSGERPVHEGKLDDDQTHAIRGSSPTGFAGENTRSRCAPSDLRLDQQPTGSRSRSQTYRRSGRRSHQGGCLSPVSLVG